MLEKEVEKVLGRRTDRGPLLRIPPKVKGREFPEEVALGVEHPQGQVAAFCVGSRDMDSRIAPG